MEAVLGLTPLHLHEKVGATIAPSGLNEVSKCQFATPSQKSNILQKLGDLVKLAYYPEAGYHRLQIICQNKKCSVGQDDAMHKPNRFSDKDMCQSTMCTEIPKKALRGRTYIRFLS